MAFYRKEDVSGPLAVSKKHRIHNNYISHVGRLTISGSGINICNSSDNIISNNLITDIPRMGITMFSQWDIPRDLCPMTGNIIKNNELARCGNSSWDGGAFYIGATSDNTTFENNRITDTWSWFNTTSPQPDDRPDDDAAIDFDPGMTYNTCIRNNLCYGENASTLEFGRFEDETILSNNYFESPDHPGKMFVNGQWIDNGPFDITRVSADTGLTSEYKLPYPKETARPVKLPLHCDFKGSISPFFLYSYSRESGHSLCQSGMLLIDSDVQLLRYRHPSPISRKVSVQIYDVSTKHKALCGAAVKSSDGKQIITLGVDNSASKSYYTVSINGKPVVTNIPRKTGWHELVFDMREDKGCVAMIDGQTVGKAPDIKSITTVDLGDPALGSDSRDFAFKSFDIE
jgi:hypothetical protein